MAAQQRICIKRPSENLPLFPSGMFGPRAGKCGQIFRALGKCKLQSRAGPGRIAPLTITRGPHLRYLRARGREARGAGGAGQGGARGAHWSGGFSILPSPRALSAATECCNRDLHNIKKK